MKTRCLHLWKRKMKGNKDFKKCAFCDEEIRIKPKRNAPDNKQKVLM